MLDGRVVVVTGAGRGLGRAHALALAARGASVVVNDLDATADEVASTIGAAAVASHHDVAADAGGLVSTALDAFGRLDAVVNNAGILRSGLLLRTTPDDWRAVLEVHLLGTMAVTRAAAAHWRNEAKAGRPVDARVVNTSSAAGLYGFVGESAYSAAKAGIVGFTLTAAAELARYGVAVNAVAPAAMTRMTEGVLDDERFGPEQVSPLVVWLCSGASAGVTGRVFEAGGGTIHLVAGWRRADELAHEVDVDPSELGDRIRTALDGLPDPMPVYGAAG